MPRRGRRCILAPDAAGLARSPDRPRRPLGSPLSAPARPASTPLQRSCADAGAGPTANRHLSIACRPPTAWCDSASLPTIRRSRRSCGSSSASRSTRACASWAASSWAAISRSPTSRRTTIRSSSPSAVRATGGSVYRARSSPAAIRRRRSSPGTAPTPISSTWRSTFGGSGRGRRRRQRRRRCGADSRAQSRGSGVDRHLRRRPGALRASSIRDVHFIVRRGPVQAKWSPAEFKELAHLEGVDLSSTRASSSSTPAASRSSRGSPGAEEHGDPARARRSAAPTGAPRRIHLRFLVSPVAIEGEGEGDAGGGHVTGLCLERNRLTGRGRRPRRHGTGERSTLPVGLVVRAVGYRSLPLAGLPFDDRRAIIPNQRGRVIETATGDVLPRLYVAGWIKRGPTGLIGSNKPDGAETAAAMLEDRASLAPSRRRSRSIACSRSAACSRSTSPAGSASTSSKSSAAAPPAARGSRSAASKRCSRRSNRRFLKDKSKSGTGNSGSQPATPARPGTMIQGVKESVQIVAEAEGAAAALHPAG